MGRRASGGGNGVAEQACGKRGGRLARAARRSALALLLAAALILALFNNLSQVILDMAVADAYALAVETVNLAVSEAMRGGVEYAQLVSVRTDESGRVTMLQADTVHMNELATSTALNAQKHLGEAENQYVSIPLGAALGIPFLAGFGPRVTVRILPVGAVETEFATEFAAAGINQTRHRISLIVRTTVRLVIPTGAKRVEVNSHVAIAESIIVGLVPDSFVDVADRDEMLNLLP